MGKSARSTEQIVAELSAFKASEFDFENEDKLNPLLDELQRKKDRANAVDAMLDIFERYPKADLGQPGPLVHMLEQISKTQRQLCEQKLTEAIKRKPTYYTVWMVHRELNVARTPAAKRKWKGLLLSVLKHKSPGPEAKATVKEFLAEDE